VYAWDQKYLFGSILCVGFMGHY